MGAFGVGALGEKYFWLSNRRLRCFWPLGPGRRLCGRWCFWRSAFGRVTHDVSVYDDRLPKGSNGKMAATKAMTMYSAAQMKMGTEVEV